MLGLLGMAYYSSPSSSSSPGSIEVAHDYSRMDQPPQGEAFHDENYEAVADSIPTDVEQANSESDDDMEDTALQTTHIMFCGKQFKRRTLGILAAAFTGIYGGSIMVPMHYAPPDDKGMGYLISFAIGASIVNLALWIVRYLYLCKFHSSFSKGYLALPSFHFRKMWPYGGACGLMWSIGNFCSIISVEFLGEGVGYSVVQLSMLGKFFGIVRFFKILDL